MRHVVTYRDCGDAIHFFTERPPSVPFNIPILEFGEDEHFKVLDGSNDGKLVLFKPQEWRGDSGGNGGIPFAKQNYVTASDMAARINGLKPGTVTHIYLTSDGGASLDTLYDLVPLLDSHVSVVSPNVAVQMALQSFRSVDAQE